MGSRLVKSEFFWSVFEVFVCIFEFLSLVFEFNFLPFVLRAYPLQDLVLLLTQFLIIVKRFQRFTQLSVERCWLFSLAYCLPVDVRVVLVISSLGFRVDRVLLLKLQHEVLMMSQVDVAHYVELVHLLDQGNQIKITS